VTVNGELGLKKTLVACVDIVLRNARGSTDVRFIVFLNAADVMESSEAGICREFGIRFSPAVPFTIFDKRDSEVL